MSFLSREEVREKLKAWGSAKVSTLAMHIWADEWHMKDDVKFDDIQGEHSAIMEVLAELSMLDMNLITEADIPIFMAFLNAEAPQFEESYLQFVSGLQNIDREQRKRKLKNTEPYIKYCLDE